MPEINSERRKWELRKAKILFFAGLGGTFIYLILVELLGKDFHVEFLLGFITMMGVALAQGVDKK